jgi:ribulose-phosphate 3-epimerase
MICSPSFLSSDFNKLKSEIESVSYAKWLHFDVMDGNFVKNTTYNHLMVKEIKTFSKQFFDVHLMIDNPEKYYHNYISEGADLVTFHYEATEKPLELIQAIKSNNILAGISLKPDSPVNVLDSLLPYVDLILIMSVEPGEGGQDFLPSSLDKLAYLDELRNRHNYSYYLEVDGGINLENAKLVKDKGCDVIVVGSFIFKKENRRKIIEELENV